MTTTQTTNIKTHLANLAVAKTLIKRAIQRNNSGNLLTNDIYYQYYPDYITSMSTVSRNTTEDDIVNLMEDYEYMIEIPDGLSNIREYAFRNKTALKIVKITDTSGVIPLDNVNAFYDTPIEDGDGGIYVPSLLQSAYKAADNWIELADYIYTTDDIPDYEYTNIIETYECVTSLETLETMTLEEFMTDNR